MTLMLLLAILGSPGGLRDAPSSDRTAELFTKASPEHKVAMLEAKKWIPSTHLGVAKARTLLARVDVLYAEDAAQIVSLTELFWRQIREEGQEASAIEILEGAIAWRDPAYFQDGKREFEEFIALYSTLRIGRNGRIGFPHAKSIAFLKAKAKYATPASK